MLSARLMGGICIPEVQGMVPMSDLNELLDRVPHDQQCSTRTPIVFLKRPFMALRSSMQ